MENKSLLEIARLTRLHEKEYEPRTAIYKAMKEFGIKDNDPAKTTIFREVAKAVAEARAHERELAVMKKEQAFRDAAANQARHPEDAYRNL